MANFSEIVSKLPKTVDTYLTYLQIDALYLHAARQACSHAFDAKNKIEAAKDHWKSLEETESRILGDHEGDTHSAYDDLEPIYRQMESAHYEIGETYAPMLKELAVVHMLCVGALEAHINSIAKESLGGKEAKAFEKLALNAKWLFLPRMLGCPGFEPGHQPFQRFSKLLKHRNELIHYKQRKEAWVYGEVPKFLLELGLTTSDAEQSIEAVQSMIEEFARQRGADPPYWLRSDLNQMSYFDISVE